MTAMAAPKRTAPRRTASAIAEDLHQARKVGGIWRAGERDLTATIDFLSVVDSSPGQAQLVRARDLLASYITCQQYGAHHPHDKTAQAAVHSLQTLLLRPEKDDRLAQRIRSDSIAASDHSISPDAVRHREDRIVSEIAQAVASDLQSRRGDEPQTIEAGIHRLFPVVSDLRQQLHDGLCLTYLKVPPPDPRERRVIEGFYRQAVVKLGHLLVRSQQLADLARRAPNLTEEDYYFVGKARTYIGLIFDEADDRTYMHELLHTHDGKYWEPFLERLLATERGQELYRRWIEWAQSCFATCAFERSTDTGHMCTPHALITWLYDFEIAYEELGLSKLNIPGNIPLLHHGLQIEEQDESEND